MTTRWLDLRFLGAGAFALLLLYATWPERTALIAALILILLILLIGAVRFVSDAGVRVTNGGGFPSQADQEREHDQDFDLLRLEQDILTRLNQARQARGIDPVGLHSDLLFRARRHSLRMIKVPFFGTKDIEEGDLCENTAAERSSMIVGALIRRFNDNRADSAEYCVRSWLGRKRTRRILLCAGFRYGAVGVLRNSRTRSLYVSCLLEAPSSCPFELQ